MFGFFVVLILMALLDATASVLRYNVGIHHMLEMDNTVLVKARKTNYCNVGGCLDVCEFEVVKFSTYLVCILMPERPSSIAIVFSCCYLLKYIPCNLNPS